MKDSMTQTRPQFVTRHDQRGVAIITLAHPPRNGLEPEVIAEAQSVVQAALLDAEVRALVITGGGTGFASGADVRGAVVRPDPALSALCRLLEDARKPTAAAIHGAAIGPGLELALACHFRVAQVDTQFSFPDIALGWLPAAGGIQRLTRIVGGRAAMSALLGGRAFSTPRAEQLGLLDIVTQGARLDAAITRALQVPPRPTRKRLDALVHSKLDLEALAAERTKRAVVDAPTGAPRAILACIEAALTDDMASGFRLEARLAATCAEDQAARALRAIFLARRDAVRPKALDIGQVSVGRLGLVPSGDAQSDRIAALLGARALRANLALVVGGDDPDARASLSAQIERHLQRSEVAGHLSAGRLNALMNGINLAENLQDIGSCDVVFMGGVRPDVLAHTRGDAVCLCPSDGQVVPAPLAAQVLPCRGLMAPRAVLELCPSETTSPKARALGLALARALDQPAIEVPAGKPPVLPALEAAWLVAADHLLMAGASVAQIDAAFAKAGWREGPFVRQDRFGIVATRTRIAQAAAHQSEGGIKLAASLIAAGQNGIKSGLGYYTWDAGELVGENPAVQSAIALLQPAQKPVLDADIVPYCAAAISNQAARILGAQGVARASDLDVAAVFGLGWPRGQGGPIWAAEDEGLGLFLSRIWGYSARDATFWQPAPLLENAVAKMRETLVP